MVTAQVIGGRFKSSKDFLLLLSQMPYFVVQASQQLAKLFVFAFQAVSFTFEPVLCAIADLTLSLPGTGGIFDTRRFMFMVNVRTDPVTFHFQPLQCFLQPLVCAHMGTILGNGFVQQRRDFISIRCDSLDSMSPFDLEVFKGSIFPEKLVAE
jgi:hypothetical protein